MTGEREKMVGNYWLSSLICSPGIINYLTSNVVVVLPMKFVSMTVFEERF